MPINSIPMTEGIGFVAAACTTLSFVPQLVKIRKQGGRDLSYGMLWIYFLGLVLWLVYGVRLHAQAVIAANAVAIVLVGAALLMKHAMQQPPRPAPMPEVPLPEPYVCDNPLEMFPAYPPAVEPERAQALAYAARRS
jgi:MtN3 and saliva related transmembrane protein